MCAQSQADTIGEQRSAEAEAVDDQLKRAKHR